MEQFGTIEAVNEEIGKIKRGKGEGGKLKVYGLQKTTLEIVAKLQLLAPDRPLNDWFMDIYREGTGKTFSEEDNRNSLAVTRPIVEAFFHARYFLEIAVKYGKELTHKCI